MLSRFGRRTLAAALVSCAAAVAAWAAEAPSGLGGWIVPWDFEAGMQSVARGRGTFDEVFLFAARLDPSGNVVLDERKGHWPDALRDARAAGARVWLTVVNDVVGAGSSRSVLKDSGLVHDLLASPERCAAHRADIVTIATRLGVEGVDLDYENLPVGERERFSTFVRALAEELHARGLALSVTVQPKTAESSATGPGAMDWRALCSAADRIQVMLYNEHNASTGPGPVAGIDWVRRVADYGLRTCPAKSLVPVLKVSGMDWGPGRSDWLSFAEASSIVARVRPKLRREREDRVPWFAYRAADGRHVVYFEDAQSLAAKSEVLRSRGLSRIVLWSLGSEDPDAPARIAGAERGQNR
jgi:spore germination protein YaaH